MRGAAERLSYVLTAIVTTFLVVSILTIVIVVPLVLVQLYLYPRKQGVWYQWKHGARRPARDSGVLPAHRRYPGSAADFALRTSWEKTMSKQASRTRLFEAESAAESVSRPAILLTVAGRLERSGKKAAARTCYRQILERFGETKEAGNAELRLDSLETGEAFPRRAATGQIG
jgi:hypothetical protein